MGHKKSAESVSGFFMGIFFEVALGIDLQVLYVVSVFIEKALEGVHVFIEKIENVGPGILIH